MTSQKQVVPHRVKILDCPIEHVTVYKNCALVERLIKVSVVEGEQKVIISGFCDSVVEGSIRVSGHGPATILDVSYQIRVEKIKEEPRIVQKRKEIEDQIKDLKSKLKTFQQAKTRLAKEKEFLQKYAKSVVQVSKDDKKVSKLLSNDSLDGVTNFMKFYSQELERLDTAVIAVNKERMDLQQKIVDAETQLAKFKPTKTYETHREFVVTLDGHKKEECELHLVYRVNAASWKAMYDVHVGSNDSSFSITYFGSITQKTGEDWVNVELSLSTADPNMGAEPPELNTLTIGYYSPPPIVYKYEHYSAVRAESSKLACRSLKVAESTAEQGATSTTFHISGTSTIPSDNSAHKVTISMLKFSSEFNHYTVPKLDTTAFLKVNTTNDSEFPLLPGIMNVFFDKNFIASGTMQAVSPKEKFESYLGPDPGVKVVYKPVKRFHESGGFIKGYNKIKVEKKIVVKNTKPIDIDLTIVDQYPRSLDEKIKVKMTQPDLPNGQTEIQNVKLSGNAVAEKLILKDTNQLEWKLKVKPQQEVEVPLEYNVTWPSGMQLDTTTV